MAKSAYKWIIIAKLSQLFNNNHVNKKVKQSSFSDIDD